MCQSLDTLLYPGFPSRFELDRKSTRLNSSHGYISYAVFCLKKKNNNHVRMRVSIARTIALVHVRPSGYLLSLQHANTVSSVAVCACTPSAIYCPTQLPQTRW